MENKTIGDVRADIESVIQEQKDTKTGKNKVSSEIRKKEAQITKSLKILLKNEKDPKVKKEIQVLITSENSRRMKRDWIWWLILWCIVAIVIIGLVIWPSNNDWWITSGRCSSEMKQAVKDEYKSPSTVKFISCHWDKSKGIYWEADAQNGFGATIRTEFLCNGDSCLIVEKGSLWR